MNGTGRLASGALVMAIGAGMLGAGVPAAHAESADCIVQYQAKGRTTPHAVNIAVGEIHNVAGSPYSENEINSIPKALALASNAHEGFVGEVVLGTSGVYPENPTQAKAQYPAVEGGQSAKTIDHGPLGRTTVETAEGRAYAESKEFGQVLSDQLAVGPSTAVSDSVVGEKGVTGRQEGRSYDIKVGGTVIGSVRSLLEYTSDGTADGTKASWVFEFHRLQNGTETVWTASGDGVAAHGAEPQPGAATRQQLQTVLTKVSDALYDAGVTRADVQLRPGELKVSAGRIDATGALLVIGLQVKHFHHTALHSQALEIGHVWEEVIVNRGECSNAVKSAEAPAATTGGSANGAGMPMAALPARSDGSALLVDRLVPFWRPFDLS